MKPFDLLQPGQVSGGGAKAHAARGQPRAAQEGGRDGAGRTQAALDRLAGFLASGNPPRQDAPRGTYLNITV